MTSGVRVAVTTGDQKAEYAAMDETAYLMKSPANAARLMSSLREAGESRDNADVLAQLRHAYSLLAAGSVKNQKQFADGLIAPQIRRLERQARSEITEQV